MHVTPPANVFETIGQEATVRGCPGCGASIDLREYGLLTCSAMVVCRACSHSFRMVELV